MRTIEVGIQVLVTTLLVIARLIGWIKISWWIVFSPIWTPIVVAFGIVIVKFHIKNIEDSQL